MLELQKLRVQKDAAEKQLRRLQEVEIQRSRRRAVTEEKHRRRIDQLQALQVSTLLYTVQSKLLYFCKWFGSDDHNHHNTSQVTSIIS